MTRTMNKEIKNHMFASNTYAIEFGKNLNVQELDNSNILVAKKEIIIPEKRIILLDEVNDTEMHIVKNIGYKGGLIV